MPNWGYMRDQMDFVTILSRSVPHGMGVKRAAKSVARYDGKKALVLSPKINVAADLPCASGVTVCDPFGCR